ncbi:Histidine decarboxylase [Sarcoptes scabiei]|uniref:Histidine decarboxylase n=1 Tax=Sarcoptes scabiei TaxID=52283 RepID=A0A834R7K1_SARSC|nr:Histidine decarboxylase [Sarcoptes scabiei]
MNWEDFRKYGKELVDYIADYLINIRTCRVFPNVKPGYMKNLLPESAPLDGEDWLKIFDDFGKVVMPGITHWQSPYMHAYFPALNCPASLLGDMLANAINALGFTWASCPACTELEIIVMDWLGQMIGLPDDFLHSRSNGNGGGVIQTTASEATFVSLLAARTEMIRRIKIECDDETLDDAYINSRLVAYCSDQAHSSVEKAGLIGLVKMHFIESDDNFVLRGDKLVEAIRHDREDDLIPFFLCVTLGTTGACAFDNLKELGPIAIRENIWIHVDAAYAGSAFICPEYRVWMEGIEMAQTIAFNPSKWLMVHFDCTAMWVKNSGALHRTFNVDPLYLKHENTGLAIDFMHWQIPLSKRFRALKLWFVIRNYGVRGLQNHLRKGIRMAMAFEELVKLDKRFEIPAKRHLGMVVFRLKGHNQLTELLLKKLNSSGKLHCVPASLKGTYVIRFTVTSHNTELSDVQRDWYLIKEMATIVLKSITPDPTYNHIRVPLGQIKKKSDTFGTSLLLFNCPSTPKIINASFVAIFDNQDLARDYMKYFKDSHHFDRQQTPALRRRIKGLMLTDKQHSLDSRIDLMSSIIATHAEKVDKNETDLNRLKSKIYHNSADDSLQAINENNRSQDDLDSI